MKAYDRRPTYLLPQAVERGGVVENGNLREQVEQLTAYVNRLTRELEATRAIGHAISQSLQIDEVLATSLDKVLQFMHVNSGALHIFDATNGSIVRSVYQGFDDEVEQFVDPKAFCQQLALFVAKSGQPVLVEDTAREPALPFADVGATGVRSFASLPLQAKGRTLGAFAIISHVPKKVRREDLDVLSIIATQTAIALDNAQMFAETARREREAEALYRVGREISALLDTDRVLNTVVENARQLVGTDAAALTLLDERTNEVFMKATSGIRTKEFLTIRIPKGEGPPGQAVTTGRPVIVEDYTKTPARLPKVDRILRAEGLMAHLAVPLKFRDRVLGSLSVYQRRAHSYSDRDIKLLAGLASQAAIAIENARLYEQVQQLAMLSERDRLAREMHDGLAQELGYLMLSARALSDMLKQGETASALAQLAAMRETMREAYNDVRASIFGLRTSASISKGLIPWLREYLGDYAIQTNIATELICDQPDATSLAPATEAQLGFIIQEALTNIRKHAAATRAWVTYRSDEDAVRITIGDNGQGFDAARAGGKDGHFGLEIMDERAQSVGGRLEIVSEPGKGAQVTVVVPHVPASIETRGERTATG